MNVNCGNCPAKYAVPDEKVRGRKVKITCKRCGAPIIVDGSVLGGRPTQSKRPGAASAPPAAASAPPSAAAPAAAAARAAASKAASVLPVQPSAAKSTAPIAAARASAARPEPATAASRPAAASTGPRPGASAAESAAAAASAARAAMKRTMIGVAPPAAGSAAPTPPAAEARPALAARAAAPSALQPDPPAPAAVSRANRDIKRTMIGGLDAPAVLARAAAQSVQPLVSVPRLEAKPAPAMTAPPWTVAITDEQHEEMSTNEVVELFVAGTINVETFIWREGMDDWQMPFDIPPIATALAARGFGPGRAPAHGREIGRYTDEPSHDQETAVTQSPLDHSEDQTVATAPPFDPGGSPAGVWREPGNWNEPPRAPGADQYQREVSFDDVTVSMAAPQAEELLRAAELAAALEKEDEPTAIFNASAEASLMSAEATLPIPLAAPRPAAGQPARAAAAAREPRPARADPAPARALLPFEAPDRSRQFEQPAPLAAAAHVSAEPAQRRPSDSSRPAARRASADVARRDLFGDAARAGGEDHEEPVPSEGPRMMGARNESSVLFSLDALVASDEPAVKPETRAREEDLLAPSPPPRRPAREEPPDSLINVGGPAMFGNALAAPDFSAPVAEPPPPLPEPMPEPQEISSEALEPVKSGGGALVWVVLLLFLLLAGAVALVLYLRPELRPAALFGKRAETQAPLEPTAAPPAAPIETAGAIATESASNAEPGESATAPASSGPTGAAAERKDERRSDEDRKAEDRKREDTPDDQKATDKPEAKPEEPKPPGELGPIDRAAAASALNGAASSASGCKQLDGPTGSGRATVTFAPSGRATNAVITGDFAGTAVGGCVARIFRGARVPPFSGEPVTVAKSFSIN